MAGIYIHIPFCRKKCNYCNFFSLATRKFRDEFHRALLREIEITRSYLGNETVDTIYFGGGTPSLLDAGQIGEILMSACSPLKERGEIPEITLELNPEDVTPEYLEGLSVAGINRLSLGVQSFFDEDLQYLGRNHDAMRAVKALEIALKIENLSVDLIYGIPTLTNQRWEQNLKRVAGLGIPHLSAYALTVEPKTALAWQIERGAERRAQITGHGDQGTEFRYPKHETRNTKCDPVSDDHAAEQFGILMDVMEKAGYIQYEISNFCLPGYESRHNSNYWKGIPYLGLGPSAHSYDGSSRRWNISNLTSYIRHLESGDLPFEEEELTPARQYNEYVMTSLRTRRGCDCKEIGKRFGDETEDHFRHQAVRFLASGALTECEGIYTLTREGKFLADGISAGLFTDED